MGIWRSCDFNLLYSNFEYETSKMINWESIIGFYLCQGSGGESPQQTRCLKSLEILLSCDFYNVFMFKYEIFETKNCE